MKRREKIRSTLKELGALYGDQLINTTGGQVVALPMSVRDKLLDMKKEVVSLLEEAQQEVAAGGEAIRTALTEGDPLRERISDVDFGYPVSRSLIRVDVIVNQDLQPRLVEVSTARFDGLLYFWAVQEAFKSAGIKSDSHTPDFDFSRDGVYPRKVTGTLLHLRPARPPSSKIYKQVAFLVSRDNGVFQEFLMIPRFERKEGCMRAIPIVADPKDISYDRGRKELKVEGREVDIVYYYPPLNLNDEVETIETLLGVANDQTALVVGLQEVLYDNKFWLTRWTESVYVAQTLLVSENWKNISERTRQESVLKLATSCYAKEVHIGTTMSERKYRNLLERAQQETARGRLWVWQKFIDPLRIESEEEGKQLKLKLSLFITGGWYGGTMATLAPSYKIHDCWYNAPIKWEGKSRSWADEEVLKVLTPMLAREVKIRRAEDLS